MLGVDEAGGAATLLGLGDHAEGQGGLAGALGAVDLGDATPGDAADPQGRVQGRAAGGDGGWRWLTVGVGVVGDAGADAPVDLGQRGMEVVGGGWWLRQPNGCGGHDGWTPCRDSEDSVASQVNGVG